MQKLSYAILSKVGNHCLCTLIDIMTNTKNLSENIIISNCALLQLHDLWLNVGPN